MSKKAVIMARAGGHQRTWGAAFAAGLKRHGWQVVVQETYSEADLFVTWGVRGSKRKGAFKAQRARKGEICVLERGYIGDRFAWTSVSFGGALNGRAEFRGVQDCNFRFKKHHGHLLQPWRQQSGYALLIGQKAGDASIRHLNIIRWYQERAKEAKALGLDVHFRKHPRGGLPGGLPKWVTYSSGALLRTLAGASCCITCNSNTAVEAVLNGCPTIATDAGSMAWEMCGHKVGEMVAPSRERWAARLAWCQWTLDEIAAGVCWDHIGKK